MSAGKRFAMAVIGMLVILSLVGSNVVVTAERTALSSEYVTDTLEAENAYGEATDVLRDSIADRVTDATAGSDAVFPPEVNATVIDADRLVADALTEPYVRSQIDRNVNATYAFLHGDTRQLSLSVDLRPVKSNLATAASEQAVAVDVATLAAVGAENADGTERPIDTTTVEGLLESESSYQRTKTQFRESQPDGTDMDAVNRQLKDDVEASTREAMAGYDQELTDATVDLQFVTVDALTTDLTHGEYRQQVTSIQERLGDRVRELFRDRLDEELPDTFSMTDDLDADARDRLDTTAETVSLIDTLHWLLPVAAVALLGLAFAVTQSPRSVGRTAGTSALVAGFVGLIPAVLARDPLETALRDAISGEGSARFAEVAVAIVDGILLTLRNQSFLLVAFGVVLLVLVFADRRMVV